MDTFQFFFVTSVATSYSNRTKENSSACELHFLLVWGLDTSSSHHATKGPTAPFSDLSTLLQQMLLQGLRMERGWGPHTHCSRAAVAQFREARWCPASGLPTQHQKFVSEQRAHLLGHASPCFLLGPPYQCWQQALTHLYFVTLFRTCQMSDLMQQTITKKGTF